MFTVPLEGSGELSNEATPPMAMINPPHGVWNSSCSLTHFPELTFQQLLILFCFSLKRAKNTGVGGDGFELADVIVMAKKAIIPHETGLMTTGADIFINNLEVGVKQ